MEQLRKLGAEYHTEEKSQQDVQKPRLRGAGGWPVETTLQPLRRKQRPRKSHGHITRPDRNQVPKVQGRVYPSRSFSNSIQQVQCWLNISSEPGSGPCQVLLRELHLNMGRTVHGVQEGSREGGTLTSSGVIKQSFLHRVHTDWI